MALDPLLYPPVVIPPPIVPVVPTPLAPTGLAPTAAAVPTPLSPTGLAPASMAAPLPAVRGPEDVADNINRVAAQDSPLMQQARVDGLRVAQKRGLLNSSIAAGAAQDAAMRFAVPIGSQNAQQIAQKQIADKQIEAERLRQETDIIARKELLGMDLTAQEKRQQIDNTARLDLLTRELGSRATLQEQQLASQAALQTQELGSRASLQASELAHRTGLQATELAALQIEKQLDRVTQEKLASWQLDATDRGGAAQLLASIEGNYMQAVNNINGNPDMSSDDRNKALQSLKNLRDSQIDFVQQIYQTDLTWPTEPPPGPGPGTPPPPPPVPGEGPQWQPGMDWDQYRKSLGAAGSALFKDKDAFKQAYPGATDAQWDAYKRTRAVPT